MIACSLRCALAAAFAWGLVTLAGCGSTDVPGQKVDTSQRPTLKKQLEDIAQSGQPIGSGGQALRDEAEKVRATDPAKADRLIQDLDELQAMTDPGQIKTKAKAMADQL